MANLTMTNTAKINTAMTNTANTNMTMASKSTMAMVAIFASLLLVLAGILSASAIPTHACSTGNSVPSNSVAASAVVVCPFCAAVKQTLSEEMFATDAIVIAKVVGTTTPSTDGFAATMKMQVLDVIKGQGLIQASSEFETIVPANFLEDQECLVMGVMTETMSWSTPMKLTPRSKQYIFDLQNLPPEGPDRLKFFVKYLEDEESMLAYDAYDEFARASYETVIAIKPEMNRPNLLKWITDPEVTINRKRLYYTLLGVCGQKEDLPLLEKLITSPDKKERAALDALVACYLTLAGADGVALIEERFLKDKEADYVDTYAAVAALRFHGTESEVIPLPRILSAVRLLLDRPEVADLVIPDLARWKDWSVIERLVEMFKNANEKTNWVRVPIINYLRVCPDPIAKEKIEELKKVDAQAVRRALAFFEVEDALGGSDDDEDSAFEKELKELETGNATDGKQPPKVDQPPTKDVPKEETPSGGSPKVDPPQTTDPAAGSGGGGDDGSRLNASATPATNPQGQTSRTQTSRAQTSRTQTSRTQASRTTALKPVAALDSSSINNSATRFIESNEDDRPFAAGVELISTRIDEQPAAGGTVVGQTLEFTQSLAVSGEQQKSQSELLGFVSAAGAVLGSTPESPEAGLENTGLENTGLENAGLETRASVETRVSPMGDGANVAPAMTLAGAATALSPPAGEAAPPQPPLSLASTARVIGEGRERSAALRTRATSSSTNDDLQKSYFWWVLGVPVVANLLLLVLAWSLFSGTFSRLFS